MSTIDLSAAPVCTECEWDAVRAPARYLVGLTDGTQTTVCDGHLDTLHDERMVAAFATLTTATP